MLSNCAAWQTYIVSRVNSKFKLILLMCQNVNISANRSPPAQCGQPWAGLLYWLSTNCNKLFCFVGNCSHARPPRLCHLCLCFCRSLQQEYEGICKVNSQQPIQGLQKKAPILINSIWYWHKYSSEDLISKWWVHRKQSNTYQGVPSL